MMNDDPIELGFPSQAALLWPFSHYDGEGQPVVEHDFVEIVCRLNWNKAEAIGPQGVPIALDAGAIVDRKIAVGSMLWLGVVEDLPGTAGVPETDILLVKTYAEALDIEGNVAMRTVGLMRYTNVLPREQT